MNGVDVLREMFGRVGPALSSAIQDLDGDALTARVDGEANTLAWLAWHVGREQDAQVAAAVGRDQVWTAQGFSARFALPFDDAAIGYGQSSTEVGQVRASAALLAEYLDAVQDETADVLDELTDGDLYRVVDADWDPPVTLGVRLVSVVEDALQHAGQAGYLRGLIDRGSVDDGAVATD
ncbi:hypothetical protein GCM10025865_23620 [Paraoerskovia sediminicola]|uniref:DUF664 domain-containing protein n=2 Tax=Paraoerskovia sediminicola TaxID=1138587 RepID=A0ABN6XDQ2_9CELL|nr:DUF664 domain-containing protein [Paraoerskovia sediminicola]BDZ43063.1 hypothetical protein GCM10025865_23620 [Paraoerskovia sediminicola]